jgi:ATP-dependent helicase Lhr and Lhr-like helicase
VSDLFGAAEAWFDARGWAPFDFQREAWAAYLLGESGLIHAATGTGKTMAVWWGPLLEWLNPGRAEGKRRAPDGLKVLWVTPMRALAADTERALREVVFDLGTPWTVERRTGDTGSSAKARQLKKPPAALVTTPESLALMLSQEGAREYFAALDLVVVDEWHELLGSKRGSLTELGLARLRGWRPGLRLWGLSATLGNLDEALAALVGVEGTTGTRPRRLIRAVIPKQIVVDSLIPPAVGRFPWAGHLGLVMLPQVVAAIEESRSTLVFTNTRNQAEKWYQSILAERPDWAGLLALHHGSLAADTRAWVEDGLREGRLIAVVATASLDLGVDFSPVDRVLQIGSPKGIARLLQRAGRSGHQPGAVSRVSCVPTNALELVEAAAAREAAEGGRVEPRVPLAKPLDVLVQHLVTAGLGGGFVEEELLAEVRTAYSYRHLSDVEWRWALDFVVNGGSALTAYPEYRRLVLVDGRYRVVDRDIAQRHRLSIGTITSDPMIEVKYLNGPSLGSTSESFISRLKPGDRFIFAGVPLEFRMVREMTAWVRRANSVKGAIPTWTGTGLPISQELSDAVLAKLGEAREGRLEGPEMEAVAPVLRVQTRVSTLPAPGELLVERVKTREGHHLFLYPFAGKLVNAGLAALFAFRLSRRQPITFTTTANDYGLELLAPDPVTEPDFAALLSTGHLLDDILASMNAGEMAKRQFREIARVAGLIFQGFPGRHHPARHLQASSSLFYEVFQKYDEGNLLLAQAQREVLARQLEHSRLARILERLAAGQVVVKDVARVSPLGFPLLVERMETQLSSESLRDRIARMTVILEKWAGP